MQNCVNADLNGVAAAARACTRCADLPLGPNPVFRVDAAARVALVSQAPSTGAHRSSIPWQDASGTRLRDWLGMSLEEFHGPRLAILPAGLCYPGRLPRGGDLPPRPGCAALWHGALLAGMPGIRLTLLIGAHAQALRLGAAPLEPRVRDWHRYLEKGLFPLPHPSWRTAAWERRSPWFTAEVLPGLRAAVARALADV
jgi:uracil-DNA glycosylase